MQLSEGKSFDEGRCLSIEASVAAQEPPVLSPKFSWCEVRKAEKAEMAKMAKMAKTKVDSQVEQHIFREFFTK